MITHLTHSVELSRENQGFLNDLISHITATKHPYLGPQQQALTISLQHLFEKSTQKSTQFSQVSTPKEIRKSLSRIGSCRV